jgi:hypothetical protein
VFVILWGALIGATIGGIVELHHQDRSAEIGQFWSSSLGMAPVWVLMTISGLFGGYFYSGVGQLVGMLCVPLLAFLIDRLWRHGVRRQP